MKNLILEIWEAIKLIPGWFEDEEISMETEEYKEFKKEASIEEVED